jgi:hypothetical protein
MRKVIALTAVMALIGAVSADAANVTFGIRQTGTGLTAVSVGEGVAVNYEITATIDDGSTSTDGLALVGTDLTFVAPASLANNSASLANPGAPMDKFNYPNGVTNPPFPPGSYGGTNNGTALLQIGGGQNTIGNPGPNPPFPVGTVTTQVGTTGAQVIATGTYTTPVGSNNQTHVLALANCFANTIDNGETGPVYNVSAATASCAGTLTINVGIGVPAATATSVSVRENCTLTDSTPTPFKITEPRQPAGNTEVRIGFNIAPADPAGSGVTIQQSTCAAPAFVAYAGAAVGNGSVVGNELVIVFTPGLENARTYRLTIGADVTSIGGQTVDVRNLIGDTNADGAVNATDRSVVVSAWTGGGFSCATDLNNDNATNATDRSIVVSAWTGGAATNCAP